MSAYETVLRYHQTTKHRFQAYARGPETLDWDAQPAAFRRYEGAPAQPLPLAAADYDAAFQILRTPANRRRVPAAPGLATLGALFQLSLAVSSWKSNGIDRWAVRCNPSSGNLHPVEAYLIAEGVPGLSDGLYHYRAEDHALELRAAFAAHPARRRLHLGLSSVVWREAWKYGERGFRYCQLDVGHAIAALAYAAALLGWRASEACGLTAASLAAVLGLDRSADFCSGARADVEREEPEVLLRLSAGMPARASDQAGDTEELLARTAGAVSWHGRGSVIDARPMYRWPVIDQVLTASAPSDNIERAHGAGLHKAPPLLPPGSARCGAVQTILRRRSGQRYDHRSLMSSSAFLHLLDATLPRPQPPWETLHDPARIALLLFVHRVDGLAPGLYLLPRDAGSALELPKRLKPELADAPRVDSAHPLDLRRLAKVEPAALQRLARSICCHQDIAATSCFALAMLAEFEAPLKREPSRYRALLRSAGLIGQALYLEAEALGYRGTGIGCFFDDAVHDLLGLQDLGWQSVYHFAIGTPLDDPRILDTPAYGARAPLC